MTTNNEEKSLPRPLIALHVVSKMLAFGIFGLCSIFISIVFFPIFLIIFHPHQRFQRACRRFLHFGLILFRWLIKIMRVADIEISREDKKRLSGLSSCIVAANHPSMIDSILLISLLPCTDFIVKGSLSRKSVLSAIVNLVFIPNSMDFGAIIERTNENFAHGGTLALFPEGTRSLLTGQNKFKKGAARISLSQNAPIVPVYIGGNDKVGFRKGEKPWSVNPSGAYRYVFRVHEPIHPDEFKNLPEPIAAKRYTAKLRQILADENNR